MQVCSDGGGGGDGETVSLAERGDFRGDEDVERFTAVFADDRAFGVDERADIYGFAEP